MPNPRGLGRLGVGHWCGPGPEVPGLLNCVVRPSGTSQGRVAAGAEIWHPQQLQLQGQRQRPARRPTFEELSHEAATGNEVQLAAPCL
eukprot:4590631-Pyramimonas_sp.AAC.1